MTSYVTKPYYNSHSAVIHLLHDICCSVKQPLLDLLLSFRNDRVREIQDVGLIVDCTILPINRPSGKIEDGMKFFSGKHHSYCVKVEVGVNPKLGIASTISDIFPGSTHDYVVFQHHYPTFENKLGKAKLLADSACIGAKTWLGAYITKPCGTPELSKHRVIIERFFGRLKTVFAVFRQHWPLSIEVVGDFFIVAVCLTNFHILQNPLTASDLEANNIFFAELQMEYSRKQKAKKEANQKYLEKQRNRLNSSSSITSCTSLFLNDDLEVLMESCNPYSSATTSEKDQEKKKKMKVCEQKERNREENEDQRKIENEDRDHETIDYSSSWHLPFQWKSVCLHRVSSPTNFPITFCSSQSSSTQPSSTQLTATQPSSTQLTSESSSTQLSSTSQLHSNLESSSIHSQLPSLPLQNLYFPSNLTLPSSLCTFPPQNCNLQSSLNSTASSGSISTQSKTSSS